ncbi:S41 family peptidase [Candidatus Microgenomates bacterium]|nr:MAG: S41 family peptidase [Candidatus Microgenomates bacterium]
MENEAEMKSSKTIKLKTLQRWLLIITLVVIAGNVGYRLGQTNTNVSLSAEKRVVVNTSPPPSREVDFSLFWEVWSRLEQQYVDKTKIDPEKMVQGAISGMVASLGDPYTVYLPPKENEDFKEDLGGSFEGIGAQLGAKDDRIVVIAPLKDHPAEKAGLQPGDWIIKVNGEETYGWTVPQAVNKIRGNKGTTVNLTVVSEGAQEQKELPVVRDTITVKSVDEEMKASVACAGSQAEPQPSSGDTSSCPQVAYIKLNRFGDQTNDEWNAIVANVRLQLAQGEVKGIVLDLRNNPGGYLQSAIYVASEFLNSGIVVQQENSDKTRETYSVMRVGNLLDVPLVVLINKGSASASEILAGALRDHDRATLIGEQSFGKGSIQTPEDLPDGSGIHITTAKWLLPGGDYINGTGISPDIEIKSVSASESATLDPQLERAIEELTK